MNVPSERKDTELVMTMGSLNTLLKLTAIGGEPASVARTVGPTFASFLANWVFSFNQSTKNHRVEVKYSGQDKEISFCYIWKSGEPCADLPADIAEKIDAMFVAAEENGLKTTISRRKARQPRKRLSKLSASSQLTAEPKNI